MDQPPPYSLNLTPQTHPTDPPVSRWHPKMSPYRVFVITTTILLGTLKAVFAYRGSYKISTTLEWITGVGLTLLIFVLDEWESKKSYPKALLWFFTFDCTGLVWGTLHIFSVSRPRYRSDESNERLAKSPSVPITGYRILVSATVVVLGSVKASLAHLSHNTSANGLDWTLAVLITSLLYYIGLYESNSVDFAPNFFVRDYNTILFRFARDILVMFTLGMIMYAFVQWGSFSLSAFKKSLHEFVTRDSSSNFFIILQSLCMLMLCLWTFSTTFCISGVVATFIMITWAMRQEPEFFNFLFRHGKFARFYDTFTNWVSGITPLLLHLLQRAQRVAYIVFRLYIHLLGIITLISQLLIFVGSMKFFGEDLGFGLQGGGGFIRLLGNAGVITALLFSVAFELASLWALYYLVRSLLSPFLLYTKHRSALTYRD